ncbi:D-alanyl-D-alanine carboxypeptidase/D-alanyl-D-alanine endopeptidase [Chryseobacterium indologenes]|uniref:D-alanyl-D-alanine carboxypeptidase/D-alanyl-D-alanine-endopeptidase n=1 Tax=Chryseobacterium indologenes TaxID=253 RepID=A0AAD0YTJ9_CHRID|nr:D-alanyl-D-alanine carboxypeptidase/D-alanyl-D-alanine-endopeptidase [Chryseobacterium indologenes]ASE61465.1 D-alanyl-D-alanine carboxypeptidase/D-alanyl-D-alanine-endopeptidase [Chryseobacterium indologenes]AZB17138.1 D-alanyl-D-alanine carboxypeptidase/D-alanyl-D-alanine-endopeptidase [Chryseobacterium indologenes]TLX26666.1 D-alanyl-D-alanine carboxypeptidase/D-alanyl-D-alanine-endopeptidase [Chryseobacterium indologenes]VFA40999.1 D-alanyl-D-alanine carboxypeptidase dacC precursor [Chry
MKKTLAVLTLSVQMVSAQNIAQKLDRATKDLMDSSSAIASALSFYVSDENGNFIYEYQGNKGLSTASTQKIFTAGAALETLGKNYTFKTTSSYSGSLSGGTLNGNLFVSSNGDPTLGSWRYEAYKPENFKKKLIEAVKKAGITKISGDLVIDDSYFDHQTIPGGWPWDDSGNYYGAGVWGINWRENQFDININGTDFKSFSYPLEGVKWLNDLKAGGSSDQSLIFTAPHSGVALINGMLPGGKTVTVSGSVPNPPLQLGVEVKQWLQESGIEISGKTLTCSQLEMDGKPVPEIPKNNIILHYESPTLDKIVYWFLRKSINMYGETLIKTLGKEKKGNSSFKSGVSYLKEFWKAKGINPNMINFADGSGLSPQNYVSAKAEVQALLYAKKQSWFDAYYDGFPMQDNGMKMKSGTMRDTKSFAGYHTAKDGKKYVFSIIINNYQGSGSAELQKILNILK